MEAWNPTIRDEEGPKYLAIVRILAEDIRSGRLPPGTRLPPQRSLAKHLNVDLTTVTRAFNEARRTGLIDASAGRGSFIRAASPSLAKAATADPSGSVDFSMNMPPQPAAARLAERMESGLSRLSASAGFLDRMQYQDSAGNLADRAAGADWLGRRLGPVPVQRVIVAGGAQASLAAILTVVLKPGDALCVPILTYPGLRMAAERRGARLLPVSADGEGILPDAFLECCRLHRPRALYLVPTLDNPTTATIPMHRRERIAEIARTHGVAIIEDDAYGALPPDAPAPFASFAGRHHLAYRDPVQMRQPGSAHRLCRRTRHERSGPPRRRATRHQHDGLAARRRPRFPLDRQWGTRFHRRCHPAREWTSSGRGAGGPAGPRCPCPSLRASPLAAIAATMATRRIRRSCAPERVVRDSE